MIGAVLFDMDGLMIDSERFHFGAYRDVLKDYGVLLGFRDYLNRYLGKSNREICRAFVRRFGLNVSERKLMREKHERFHEYLISDIGLKPGVVGLMRRLKDDGMVIAIATSSHSENVEIVLSKFGLWDFIDAVACADDVRRAKPAPDIFLLAARRLGVKPSECLVLEDAPRGLIAAKRAGMECYVIPDKMCDLNDFVKADRVLKSLSDVYGMMREDCLLRKQKN